jgi:pimeloyl-ACP methyl ester carboxylesterase
MKCLHKVPGISFLVAFGLLNPLLSAEESSAAVPYGANAAAGHLLKVADARIYYETYGSGGTPLVLLHGGLYGYIAEFGDLIQAMGRHRRVIAIATRGHGKSDIGAQVFSFELFANDALAVIRHETKQKVDVLGFSDGALTSYLLAGEHPEIVRRLVAIGGPRGTQDWTEKARAEFASSHTADVEKNDPQFVAGRKKLMPEPERWDEFVSRLTKLEGVPLIIADQQIRSIEAPTLLIAGDRDPYNQAAKFLEIYHLLSHGQLMIVPGCGHLVLDHEPQLTIAAIAEFLDKDDAPRKR